MCATQTQFDFDTILSDEEISAILDQIEWPTDDDIKERSPYQDAVCQVMIDELPL